MLKEYYFYQEKFPKSGICFLTEEIAEKQRKKGVYLTVDKKDETLLRLLQKNNRRNILANRKQSNQSFLLRTSEIKSGNREKPEERII